MHYTDGSLACHADIHTKHALKTNITLPLDPEAFDPKDLGVEEHWLLLGPREGEESDLDDVTRISGLHGE